MKIINRRQLLRQDSVIFIDSQSAIKFLIYLALILECLKSLNEMVLHSNMDIPWHPLSWRIRTNLCKRINRRYLFKQDKAIFRDSRICNKVPNRCYSNGIAFENGTKSKRTKRSAEQRDFYRQPICGKVRNICSYNPWIPDIPEGDAIVFKLGTFTGIFKADEFA